MSTFDISKPMHPSAIVDKREGGR